MGGETSEVGLGRYRLDGLLGRGGMGEVHRAHDTEHDRDVALKLLAAPLADDTDFRARFLQEARIAAGLNEPHVIPIHNFGEIDGRLFLDMRLVDGRDLGAVLAGDGPLPVHRTVALAAQVAAALDTAHHHGLVHRDVKPANVLVTALDFAYLIDFGIARDTRQPDTALTPTGSVLGTPAYIAPERFGPASPTGSSDIYSLACVLFEALAGRPPFPATDLAAVMRAHLLDTPPAVSATADQPLPHGVDAVISRGMAKDPRARWPSATAMVDALSATTHPAIPPRSPRDIRRGTPPRRAGPTVAPPAPSPPRAAPPAPRPQPQRPPRPLRPQRRPSGYQRAVMLFVVMFFVLAGVSAVVAHSQRIPNVFTLPPGQQCAPHTVGLVLGEEYDCQLGAERISYTRTTAKGWAPDNYDYAGTISGLSSTWHDWRETSASTACAGVFTGWYSDLKAPGSPRVNARITVYRNHPYSVTVAAYDGAVAVARLADYRITDDLCPG